jgi:excisionase family DNA binding protein
MTKYRKLVEIDTREAADILGVTTARVIQLCEAGKLRATYHKRNDGERGKWTVSRVDVQRRRQQVQEARATERGFGQKPKAPEGAMTTSEVAQYFGVTTETVRSWARKGYLPSFTSGVTEFGRPLNYYRCEDVENFERPINPLHVHAARKRAERKAEREARKQIASASSAPEPDPQPEHVESPQVADELDELKALVLNLAKAVQQITADKA